MSSRTTGASEHVNIGATSSNVPGARSFNERAGAPPANGDEVYEPRRHRPPPTMLAAEDTASSVRRRRMAEYPSTARTESASSHAATNNYSSANRQPPPQPPPQRARANYHDPRRERKTQHKNSDDESYAVYDGNYADDEFAYDEAANGREAAARRRGNGGDERIYFIVEAAMEARERKNRDRARAAAAPSGKTFGQWSSSFAGLDDTESQSSCSDPPPVFGRPPPQPPPERHTCADLESQAALVADSKQIRTRFAHVLGRANSAGRLAIALFFCLLFAGAYVYTLGTRVAELQSLHGAELARRSLGGNAFERHPGKSTLAETWLSEAVGDEARAPMKRNYALAADSVTRRLAEDNATWATASSSKYRLGTFSFTAKDDIAKNYVRYPPTGYIKGLDRASLVHYELCCVAKNGDYICGTRHNYMYDIRMDSIVKSDEHGSFIVVMVEAKQHSVEECTLSFVSTSGGEK